MASEVDVIIGKRLRFYRTQSGVSQTALGEHVNLTFQQIQKYEKGSNRVSVSRLIEFANFLDFTISDFLDGLVDEGTKKITPLKEMKDALVEPHTIDLVRQFRNLENDQVKKSVVDLLIAMNDQK